MFFSGLSAEVAEWLVTSYKHVVGVGVDTASLDPGSSTEFTAHKLLLGAGKYGLENVNLTRDIPGECEDRACLQVRGLSAMISLKLGGRCVFDRYFLISEYGCAALALPMKIAKGTGAPLRFVAICPKKAPVSFE